MDTLNGLVVSQTKTRIRMKSEDFKDPEIGQQVFEKVRDVAGVKTALLNERTGSLLIEIDPEVFDPIELEHTVEEYVPRREESGAHKRGRRSSGATTAEVPEVLAKTKKFMRSKKMRIIENRSMTVFGGLSLAAVLAKRYGLHAGFGWAFAAAAILHTWRYRKNL